MEIQEAYRKKKALELKEGNAQIILLEAQMEKAGPQVKIKFAKEFHELRTKQRAAAEKMLELELVSGAAWGGCKQTADKVWADLKNGITKLQSQLKSDLP